MSENKKYYYLKLKENFFNSDEIVLIENMQDGILYSNILLKLYLLSLKYNGFLRLNENITYSAQMIATITRHEIGTVERALNIFLQFGLILSAADGSIYMTNIEDMVGTSSTEADRKRLARAEVKRLSGQTADKCPPNVLNLSDIRPPEIEIEKETDIKKELESERELYGRYKNVSPVYYCTCKSHKEEHDYFVCSNYKGNTGKCTVHYLRESVLYDIVLEQVQTMLAYLQSFESDFVKSLVDKSAKDKKKEIASRRKKLEANKIRILELDGIFKRIYEDNISGKLSDERFAKLSADYEREQKQLISDTEALENELNQEAEQVDNVEYFLNIVRQYTEIKELSARVVNDLIDKIKVHAVDKSSGQRIQRIDIYYTAVGLIDVSQHIQELAI